MFNKLYAIWNGRAARPWGQGSGQSPPPAQTPQFPPKPAAAMNDADPFKPMMNVLYAHGYKAAQEANEISPDPARRAVLHQYAAGQVRLLYKGAFDPINYPDDAVIQEALDSAKTRERKLEADQVRAVAARNEAQRNVPAEEPRPRPSPLVILCAINGFMLAFGSSIYELPLIKTIDDDQTALLISFAIGGALGALCVFSMFGVQVHDEKASATWSPKTDNPAWQMVAGGAMILAFALVRTYAATGPRDWLITAGLSAVDIGVLMYAKGEAERHRRREDLWAQRCDARHHKALLAEVTESQRAAVEVELKQAKADRAAAEGKLEQRMRLCFDLEGMTQAAVSAIDEGYARAIDANNGRYATGKEKAA